MLEPLQNGGRKFNLSWLRGFSLGLDRDPRVFCGTSASRTLVIGPHRKPQNHLVLATVNVYFLSAERRPCSPIIQAVTESEKEPSSQVHTHCSLTHRHLSRGCSLPECQLRPSHLPAASISSVPQGCKMELGFYRTCLVRECIYKNHLANCGESQDNKSEGTGEELGVQKEVKAMT